MLGYQSGQHKSSIFVAVHDELQILDEVNVLPVHLLPLGAFLAFEIELELEGVNFVCYGETEGVSL